MSGTRTSARRRGSTRRGRRIRPAVLVAAGAALALVAVGGGTAYAMDDSVTLDTDGEQQTVHTFGGTVQDVLDAADITLGEDDAIAPSLDTEIGSGDHVVVRSLRDLTVEIDGHEVSGGVHAATLEEGLPQLGLDLEGVELSEAPETEIPEDGLDVTAERAPRMSVMYDTVRTETRTTGETVQDVLDAAGVEPGEHDIVSPKPDEPATDGMVVDITPVLGEPEVEEIPIEAEEVEEEDPDLPAGEREVVTEAEDGVKEVTTATILHNGEERERELDEEIVTEPVEGLVKVGTQEEEEEGTAPEGGGAAGDLNWAGLAECESGGDPTAVNSAGGYYGLYQFSEQTWQSVGGTGLPSEAPPGEQTQRAQQLYNDVGGNWQSQWPECGVHLHE
ncbi:resuscitation-promoting factor [Nocardiopsis xinjiangensis]|uniref:resuscitation-promoting factor n=1 Tax=Nocardiopsis xinjiangensis TaxID=124285 RepID=UPI000684597C|nr:resuscitation-promoting factor [Nocardiopsis xinjiangensis]